MIKGQHHLVVNTDLLTMDFKHGIDTAQLVDEAFSKNSATSWVKKTDLHPEAVCYSADAADSFHGLCVAAHGGNAKTRPRALGLALVVCAATLRGKAFAQLRAEVETRLENFTSLVEMVRRDHTEFMRQQGASRTRNVARPSSAPGLRKMA